MTSPTELAFAHPVERARATAPDALCDRISLRDHIVEVEIGAFQTERGTTQRLCFNVVVEVRPVATPVDDDVDRILSYDRVTEAIAEELAAERLNLLETLAERVAARILSEPQALRVFVRIEKLDRGAGALGVEIMRDHAAAAAVDAATAPEPPKPRIVYLTESALADARLGDWLTTLIAQDIPPILCVGPRICTVPQTGHKMTQRRIDLLGIEQNAWRLAALDRRCLVVASRTEMEWALRNGQVSVWAPSKIVLDAGDASEAAALGAPVDAVALAAWFAGEMAAHELLVIGESPRIAAPVPVRQVACGDPLT